MSNEKEIIKIVKEFENVTKAFYIEYEDNKLTITDGCEGIDLRPLTKEMCYKLSDLFKQLGNIVE